MLKLVSVKSRVIDDFAPELFLVELEKGRRRPIYLCMFANSKS